MFLLVVHVVTVAALAGMGPRPGPGPGPGDWPLEPRPVVVRPFDPPDDAWGPGHRGVDLRGQVGQSVRAALPGTVTYAGRLAGKGVVVVDHGEMRTTYEPVKATVTLGQRVTTGEIVGTLEWFGSHCLPAACLHWGLIEDPHVYLDPLTLLGCSVAPVRLLPLDRPMPRASPACQPGGSAVPVAGRRDLVSGLTLLAARILPMGPVSAVLTLVGALARMPS